MHGRKNYKRSDYSRMLLEKQKLRYTYNITESQFKNAFVKAKQMRGVTAANLLGMLETRLDTVAFRSGLAQSPFQARQIVSHGHLLLDGKKATIPSMQMKVGQTLSIKEKSRSQEWALIAVDRLGETPVTYLSCNADEVSVQLTDLPALDQIPIGQIDVQQTVSYYSRV
jgi:small subunit ribosomal protein S4